MIEFRIKFLIAVLLVGLLSIPIAGDLEFAPFAAARPASIGGRIVFGRDYAGLWVMDSDGKNEKRLTTRMDFVSAWSPDGKLIAFSRETDAANYYDIYTMNADGSDVKQITDGPGRDMFPTWSPDGKQIAFERRMWEWKNNTWNWHSCAIYVMNSDGSDVKELTENDPPSFYGDPHWSPDGRKIVFVSYGGVGPIAYQVWAMNADGSGQKMLYISGYNPVWSPDGENIAFVSWDGQYDIYVMDENGFDIKKLTDSKAVYDQPTWSPDGKKIAFVSNRDGDWDFYIMDVDGSNIQCIVKTPGDEYEPDWIATSHDIEPAGALKSTWGRMKAK
jgi:Tol biopolymer transport system component